MAAAGLWTTPSDLARAAIEVQRKYAGTSHRFLSQVMAHEMLTHQKDNWGLGFELEQSGGTPRFGHFGVNAGFIATLHAGPPSASELWRCFDYAEVELSNNLAENSMRPVALGRKNWLHVGSAQAGPKVAAIVSVVESCRRLGLPVRDYLMDVLPADSGEGER